MTAEVLAVPASAGPIGWGPWASPLPLAVFPGSTLLGILFHAGFAVLVLWLAVRWARDVDAPPAPSSERLEPLP